MCVHACSACEDGIPLQELQPHIWRKHCCCAQRHVCIPVCSCMGRQPVRTKPHTAPFQSCPGKLLVGHIRVEARSSGKQSLPARQHVSGKRVREPKAQGLQAAPPCVTFQASRRRLTVGSAPNSSEASANTVAALSRISFRRAL